MKHSDPKQKSIASFFAPRPKPKQEFPQAIVTPQKPSLQRSDSVLSKAANDGFDESFGSSDTSFGSPELNNFRNPVLERTMALQRSTSDFGSKGKKIMEDLTQSYINTNGKRDNSALLDTLDSMGKRIKPTFSQQFTKPLVVEKAVDGIELSKEQLSVIKQVVEARNNIFYTGSAGTGKSVVLRELVRRLRIKYGNSFVGVTASTGLAACNIGGQTLHRYLGIGLGAAEATALYHIIKKKPAVVKKWKLMKVLIIDEISMIDGKLFTKLEHLARLLRENDSPFGGIQVVCTGDFFQLPPVSQGGFAQYCFEATVWKVVIDKTILLTQVFRQSGDTELIDMLNALRFGKMEKEMIDKFLELQRPKSYSDGIEPTELFPTRKEVKDANFKRLNSIKASGKVYDAVDSVAYDTDVKLLDNLMCEKQLILKTDAQVMYLKNRDETIVNGSIGKVIFFSAETLYLKILEEYGYEFLYNESLLQEVILLNNKIRSTHEFSEEEIVVYDQIPPERQGRFDALIKMARESTESIYPVINFKDKNGSDNPILVSPEEFTIDTTAGGAKREISRTQLPLLLSWAMSIHKSQGQTIQRLKVDLRKIFENGQVYVALSRAVNKENLEIQNFDPNKIRASEKVKQFYMNMETIA